jgi:integrase
VTVGFDGNGRRVVRRASGKTKTAAKEKLRELLRDREDGMLAASESFTVSDAVANWLTHGLGGRSAGTVTNYRTLAATHIEPSLGTRRLRQLTADHIDAWLADLAGRLSTRTLRLLHSILNRAIRHAQARDKVRRNVVALCEVPTGQAGRPSKALTFDQAVALLDAARNSPLQAYIVVSLLTGARTEELRALTWSHIDLVGAPDTTPARPPSIAVWRSVRAGGDTKTRTSRRTLALPTRCVLALVEHRERQRADRAAAGATWSPDGLVFTSQTGTALDTHNVRRAFRKVARVAGLCGEEWTPRELRHSFVSLLSHSGVPLEDIARLVGHSGTTVTERVYRKELRPVMVEGATAMDHIFPAAAPNDP